MLIVKITSNNIFMNILNNLGQSLYIETLGKLGLKKFRKQKSSNFNLAKTIAIKLNILKITEINLIFKGKIKERSVIIRGLLSKNLNILNITDYTFNTFNGCRLKKKRRKKKQLNFQIL